jgi:hypothetical protein
VAQVVEHLPRKCEVLSSNPSMGKTEPKNKNHKKTVSSDSSREVHEVVNTLFMEL